MYLYTQFCKSIGDLGVQNFVYSWYIYIYVYMLCDMLQYAMPTALVVVLAFWFFKIFIWYVLMSSPRAKQLLPAGHVCSVNQKKAYPSKFWVTQRYLPLNSIQIYFFKYKKARTNSERVLCVGTDALRLLAASEWQWMQDTYKYWIPKTST